MDPQVVLFGYNQAQNKVTFVTFLPSQPKPIDSIYYFCSKLNLTDDEQIFLAGVIFTGVTVDSMVSCCRLFEEEIYSKNIFLPLTQELLDNRDNAKRVIDDFFRRQNEVQEAIDKFRKK